MVPTPDRSTITQRRESAAGRIADDERLRGELEDADYAPFQKWALAWADAYACSTAGEPDDAVATAAIDAGLGWIRRVLEDLVSVLGAWDSLDPSERSTRLRSIAPIVPAPGLVRVSTSGNAPFNNVLRSLPLPRK